MTNPPAIVINDATSRDIEALAPHALTSRDRTDLARAIEVLGVGEIELAMPSSGGNAIEDLTEVVAGLARARPILWGPASRHIVDAAARARVPTVYLAMKLSAHHAGRASSLDRLTRVIRHARDRGLTVALCGEDTSRTDFDLIRAVIAVAEAAGAVRFRLSDAAGVLHPTRTHALFRLLCAETDLEPEFRGHDDLGLATANTLAAVEGGATHVSVSLVRTQARSRVAHMEDVVGAIRVSTLHPVVVDLTRLPAVEARIAALLGAPAPSRRRRNQWAVTEMAGAEGR